MEHLNDKINIKFGLAISQLVDVVGVHVTVSSVTALGPLPALGTLA